MRTNEIVLQFNKSITGLAGNPYGQSVYKSQVAPFFSANEKNVIVFPDYIEDVAISFIQGFFKFLVNDYGYEKLHDLIEIKAHDEFLVRKIWENVY